MGALPKPCKPRKLPKYVQWLHSKPCIITGQTGVIVHHLTSLGHGRITRNDRWCVPLIEELHAAGNRKAVHEIGWQNFQRFWEIDLVETADRLWAEYQEEPTP